MLRVTLLLLICSQVWPIAPSQAHCQELSIQVVAPTNTLTCYIVTGKLNGRSKDFCGSGETVEEAEACALSKMEAAGYRYRCGGADTNCTELVCQGDVSCPSVYPMFTPKRANLVIVDLDCYACDGTSIPVRGDGTTWCEAYTEARATAQRINDIEKHGGIRCCQVVATPACPSVNSCPKPARRCHLPWRR